MTLLKVKKINFKLRISLGCMKCGELESYIVIATDVDDISKESTFLLCTSHYKEMMEICRPNFLGIN